MGRILITGVGGFIGRHLAEALKKKYEVLGLDSRAVTKDYETLVYDLASTKPLKINKKIDIVVHLAALTDQNFCEKNKKLAYKVNVEGTRKILEFAKKCGVEKFVYVSTGGVCGHRRGMISEGTPASPFNTYTKTKYMAELLVKKYSKFFPVIVLRYFFPYGDLAKKDQLINRFLINVDTGKEIYLNQNNSSRVNPIYIDDLVRATTLAIESSSNKFEIYNIAGKEILNIKEIALLIGKKLQKKPRFVHTGNKVENLIGDIKKVRRVLGFIPKVRFKEGVSKLVKEYEIDGRAIRLSIVIPVYNEEEILMESVENVIKALNDRFGLRYELILCENGSTDNTLKISRELEKKYQEVRVLVYPSPNFGKALKMGFLGAKGQYVVNFSVDWYSFNFLREALNLLNSYDIVVSSKLIGSGDRRALSRRIITRGYVFLSKSLLGLRTSDTHGIKAFNREKVMPIIQKTLSDKALFDTEWILRAERANLKIFELSAKVKEIRRSKSNLLRVGIQSFFDILKLKATLSKERELVSRKINEH